MASSGLSSVLVRSTKMPSKRWQIDHFLGYALEEFALEIGTKRFSLR
jgi:hypothetical protein